MTKNEKIAAGLIIGAAAGMALAIFLDTARGKKLLEDLKQIGADTIDDALQRAVKLETTFKDKMIIEEDEDITLS